MAFPVGPANGALTTINGTVYVYNSTNGSWAKQNVGAVTVTNDLTINGTLTENGNLSVSGSLIPSSSFKRNRIINGSFDIWQRGTSFTSSSVNEYSADRWRTEGYSINSVISQQTFTVGQTAVPGYPRYFCRVTTSSAPSNYWAFQQRIECPQNINGDGTYTLSFWAKSVSGTIAAGTFNYGINDNSTYSNPAITTTWQKISVTRTLSGISESSGYLSIYIVNIGTGVSSLSIDIANVQVEVGTSATPFEREIYSDTLAKCQRYLPAFNAGGSSNQTICAGAAYSTAAATFVYPFKVSARVSPTGISSTAASNFSATNSSGSYVAATGIIYGGTSSTESGTFNLTGVSGLVAGGGTFAISSSSTGQILFTGCEL